MRFVSSSPAEHGLLILTPGFYDLGFMWLIFTVSLALTKWTADLLTVPVPNWKKYDETGEWALS